MSLFKRKKIIPSTIVMLKDLIDTHRAKEEASFYVSLEQKDAETARDWCAKNGINFVCSHMMEGKTYYKISNYTLD